MNISVTLRHIRLFFSLSIALLPAACSDATPGMGDGEEETIPGRAIVFSTESTHTRASQISQMRGESFGVKAFILNNRWASAGYNAKTDANWNNVAVSCNLSGICSYSPRQVWTDDEYYSFFGYYPHTDASISVSDANHESTPYIEYRPSANDPTLHRDVMVASLLDCTSTSTGQVRLRFSHVLFCINQAVNNYNDEANLLEEVTCHFTSPLYSTYRINMNKSNPTPDGSISNAEYLMVNSRNVPNTATTGAVNITDDDRYLMLIPQKGLKGKISFFITQNGQRTYKEVEFDDSDTEFRAGYRYTCALYFVGAAINFRIIQNNEWTDNDSHIEFD